VGRPGVVPEQKLGDALGEESGVEGVGDSSPADVAGEVVGVSSPPDGDTGFGCGDEVVLATVPQVVSASNTATTQAFRTCTTA
jgi:hypothetical protein